MNRYMLWMPIITLALGSCATGRPEVSAQDAVDRATKQREEAIVLERVVWVVAENAAAGPFSYEITSRTKVLSFDGLKHRKVAAALPEGAELVSFEGRTMQPDGRVIPADTAAARVQAGQLIFELPQPAVGAVLEYKFKVRCPSPLALFYWHFQRGIPVVRSELTVSWPKAAKLGYQLVNAPSGQPTDPDISSAEGPGGPTYARISWSFFDLAPRPPGKDRFAIVVGPKEFLTEENRDSGVGWGTGFGDFDNYLPRTTRHLESPAGQPPPPAFSKGGP